MEAPLALYRRYRPETFAEVIGQDHVTSPLRAALTNNRVNHAYLFSGPRGCGKTTSARILARALNCEAGPTPEPCGSCRSCVDLARGGPGSIDVIEIDAASHGGVDDARDLRERAFFAPVSSRYKVYIIDEAHMVSTQGFNALLKLVEEPPEHLKFIFATTEPEKVIGTIRSRTHHYPFRLIPPRTLSAYLDDLCRREGVPIEPAALPLVVRAGGGSARDTLSVLDQLMGGAGEAGVTYDLTTALLGYTPDSLLDEVVDAFAADDGGSVFGVVDKVIETGQDPRRFTEDLLRRLRDLVIIAAVPDAPATGLIDVPEDAAERLVAQAARFGRTDLSRAADLVATGLTEMRGATAPRLLLELICARVLLPGADDSTDGLLARLDRLERRMSIEGAIGGPAPTAGGTPAATAPAAAPAAAPTAAPTAAPGRPAAAPPPAARPTPEPAPAAPEPRSERESEPALPARPEQSVPTPTQQPERHPDPAPVAEAVPEPTPEPPAQAAPAPAASEPAATTPAGSGLGLTDVRRLWPDLLDAVKLKRRFTWILLSQNAQVVAVDEKNLTVALLNAGARESFVSSGSDEILRQAAIDVIGRDWRVEAIVDPSAQPGANPGAEPRVTRSSAEASYRPDTATVEGAAPTPTAAPSPPAAPSPEPAGETGGAPQPPPAAPPPAEARATDPASISRAREAIQATRAEAGPRVRSGPSDDDAHPDDPDAEDQGVGGAELLQRTLGAVVIEEIPND